MSSDSENEVCKYPFERRFVEDVIRKIKECYQSRMKSDIPSNLNYSAPKSIEDAKRFAKTGDALSKEGKLLEAQLAYTQSVASAPLHSKEFSLSYDKRSSNFYNQGSFEDCILDVNHALTGKLSGEEKKKLRKRRRDAVTRRQQRKSGEAVIDININGLSPLEMGTMNFSVPVLLNSYDFDNPLLQTTSPKVMFKYEKDALSYMVATDDIDPGDPISVEEFYSGTLFSSNRFTYCARCLRKLGALIPCNSCTQTMYCSEYCREKAFRNYHRTECRIIKYCQTEDRIQQALQLIFIGTEQGKRLSKLMKKMTLHDVIIKEFKPPKLPFVGNYRTFLNVISSARQRSKSNIPLWWDIFILQAVETIIVLRNTPFFEYEDSSLDNLSEKEMFVALLLFNHLISLPGLVHEIDSQEKTTNGNDHPVGVALFPRQTLFGRSCYPNCQSFMEGCRRVIFVTRFVKAGEMLCFSAERLYTLKSLEERTADFAAYRYTCKCEACLQKWPSLYDLEARKFILMFQNDNDRYYLEDILHEAETITADVEKSVFGMNVLQNILELTTIWNQYVSNPSYELIILESLLAKVLTSLYSDYYDWDDVAIRMELCRICNRIRSHLRSAKIIWSSEIQSDEEEKPKVSSESRICEITSDKKSSDITGEEEEEETTSKWNKNEEILSLGTNSAEMKQALDYFLAKCNSDNNRREENAEYAKIASNMKKVWDGMDIEEIAKARLKGGTPESLTSKEMQCVKRKESEATITASSEDNAREAADNKSVGVRVRIQVKPIEELQHRMIASNSGDAITAAVKDFVKPFTNRNTRVNVTINMSHTDDIDVNLVSPQINIDEKVSGEVDGKTIEKEHSTTTENMNVGVEDNVNEASSSSLEGKMNEETLDADTLLAFIDDIYQSQLESSCIFDRRYSDCKSAAMSTNLRRQMGTYKRNEAVYNLTTLCASILCAPKNSKELALAYAERSAALFSMCLSRFSLLDTNRALNLSNYLSKATVKKLRKRKADCIHILKLFKNNIDPKTFKSDSTDFWEITGESRFSNKFSLDFMSPKLVFENDTLVAKQNIAPGEELMIEKYMVMAQNRLQRYISCSHCLALCDIPIPCDSCTQSAYCCETCRIQAYESYHRSECQMIKFFESKPQDSIEIIALRAFFVGTEQGSKISTLLANFRPLYETKKEEDDSAKLTCVEDFLINVKKVKLVGKSLITRLKEVLPSAIQMVTALRSIAFFSDKYNKPPPRLSEKEIISTLLLAMNLITMGLKSKFEVKMWHANETSFNEIPIGYAVYLKQNIVRHSCNPNTFEITRQQFHCLYSSRLIRKGEQVTFAKSHKFMSSSLEKRREEFAEEGFTCECEACLEDWPCLEALENREIQFEDPYTRESVIDQLKKFKEVFSQDTEDKLYETIINCTLVLNACVKRPSYIIVQFEELVERIILSKRSDLHQLQWTDVSETFDDRFAEVIRRLKGEFSP